MNGIKMSDCRFYVNEEERVVICVIPNTRDMVYNYISENFKFNDFDISFATEFGYVESTLKMPKSFMGKAVCAESDEWDEELGRMIAFSRAKDKCYSAFFKRANAMIQALDRRLGNMIDSFNTMGMKLEDKKKNLQHQIEERLSPKE